MIPASKEWTIPTGMRPVGVISLVVITQALLSKIRLRTAWMLIFCTKLILRSHLRILAH